MNTELFLLALMLERKLLFLNTDTVDWLSSRIHEDGIISYFVSFCVKLKSLPCFGSVTCCKKEKLGSSISDLSGRSFDLEHLHRS